MAKDPVAIERTLEEVADLYSTSLEEHGAVAKGVGWRDDDTHRLRFDRLCQVIERPIDEPVTINDLGCGYGALHEHLLGEGIPIGRYTGYDLSAPMLEVARARVSGPNVRFVHGGRMDTPAEYAVASGIFNVRFKADDGAWARHIVRTLDALDAASTKGFAFNALTSHVDWREDHLYYADPAQYLDLCLRRYGRHVTLLHDTTLYEWTMLVHKEPRR